MLALKSRNRRRAKMAPQDAKTNVARQFLLFSAVVLALSFSLLLSGCGSKPSQDAETASAAPQDAATNDPVAQAHHRGREWAMDNHAKLVTDCGALADLDERFGCADYINTTRP
jgi:uncharacterized protein YceK